jgi:hypothetical protein
MADHEAARSLNRQNNVEQRENPYKTGTKRRFVAKCNTKRYSLAPTALPEPCEPAFP